MESFVIHFSPHPGTLARPSTLEVLQARERTSTPSVVSTFGLTFESFKECEGVSHTLSKQQAMTSFPLLLRTYGCFHLFFYSFFITCAHTTIACYQRSSLVPSMLVSYDQLFMSTTLQRAQAIAIF
jgi:hypothetical protein